jgi:hypothetical protein
VSPPRLPVSDEAERRQRIHGQSARGRADSHVAVLETIFGERLIIGRSNRGRRSAVGMAMEFTRVISPVADMEIWSGSTTAFRSSSVMRAATVPAFTDKPASWRVLASDPSSENERHHDRRLALQNAG